MRILYIGFIVPGTTTHDRLLALHRLGHEVTGFDVSTFQSRFRLLRSAQWRLNPKILLRSLNLHIEREAERLGHVDMAWVDKGTWIFPETLVSIKREMRCSLVHYTPDAQLLMNRSKHFVECIRIYDHLVTTKEFEIDHYNELGAKHVVYTTQSYCPIRFAMPRAEARFECNVGLISDFKPNYGKLMSYLSNEVENASVWGSHWSRAAFLGRVPKKLVKGTGLWNQDYVNALSSFKIGLGLLSKYIPEEHTSRSFEIPAAGTFMLAERTLKHQALFGEGEEAEFFSSPEEMVSKAKFYLKNDSARYRIARRGHERCVRSGYDADSVMAKILKEVRWL